MVGRMADANLVHGGDNEFMGPAQNGTFQVEQENFQKADDGYQEEYVDIHNSTQDQVDQAQQQLQETGLDSTKSKGQDMIEVFIGGLAKSVKDDAVLQAASKFVEGVSSVRVARRRRSGDCRGWATLKVPDVESAHILCEELKEVDGRLVGVHISRGKPLGAVGTYYPTELYQPIDPPQEDCSLRKVFDIIRGSVDKQGLLMSTIRGVFYPRPYWKSNVKNQKKQGGASSTQGNPVGSPPAKKRKKDDVGYEAMDVVMARNCPQCTSLISKFRAQPNGQNKTALAILHEYAARLGMDVQYEEQADVDTAMFKCCARLCKNENMNILYAQGNGSGRSKKEAKQMAAAFIIESLLKKVPEKDFMCSFTRDKKNMGNPRAGIGTRTQRVRQAYNPNTSARAAKSGMLQNQGVGGYGSMFGAGGGFNPVNPQFGASNTPQRSFKRGGNLKNVQTPLPTMNTIAVNPQYQFPQFQQNQVTPMASMQPQQYHGGLTPSVQQTYTGGTYSSYVTNTGTLATPHQNMAGGTPQMAPVLSAPMPNNTLSWQHQQLGKTQDSYQQSGSQRYISPQSYGQSSFGQQTPSSNQYYGQQTLKQQQSSQIYQQAGAQQTIRDQAGNDSYSQQYGQQYAQQVKGTSQYNQQNMQQQQQAQYSQYYQQYGQQYQTAEYGQQKEMPAVSMPGAGYGGYSETGQKRTYTNMNLGQQASNVGYGQSQQAYAQPAMSQGGVGTNDYQQYYQQYYGSHQYSQVQAPVAYQQVQK